MVAGFEKCDRPTHRDAARARQRDHDLLADPGWARAEDDDAVAQIDRLVDIVRDEEDRLARALPDAGQLLLHRLAGLRVERAERLGPHPPPRDRGAPPAQG